MGLKFSKIKRAAKHYLSMKAVRKKIGLTGKSKHMRQLKRSLHKISPKTAFSSTVPTSAYSVDGYQYHPRTLFQLTGGA